MEAKLKNSYRWATVQLLNGTEFVKNEWRRVPAGLERAAKEEEYLDLRESRADKARAKAEIAEAPEETIQEEVPVDNPDETVTEQEIHESEEIVDSPVEPVTPPVDPKVVKLVEEFKRGRNKKQ